MYRVTNKECYVLDFFCIRFYLKSEYNGDETDTIRNCGYDKDITDTIRPKVFKCYIEDVTILHHVTFFDGYSVYHTSINDICSNFHIHYS